MDVNHYYNYNNNIINKYYCYHYYHYHHNHRRSGREKYFFVEINMQRVPIYGSTGMGKTIIVLRVQFCVIEQIMCRSSTAATAAAAAALMAYCV